MSRSPLFHSLRRAFCVAAVASRERPGLPPVDELFELALTRRRFLGASAVTAAAIAAGCGRSDTPPPATATTPLLPPGAQAPRIAIVGAGMAGLNAAYKLKQAGLTATIFEGANRTGGRMFTATNLLADGLTTELGGEFIDSNHEEMLNLMKEFGLERLDTRAPEAASLKPETYFVNGRHYTQEQAARAFVPMAKKILVDYDALGDVVDHKTEGGGTKIDRMSIAQYLDGIGLTGWMRELIDVAYVTEYGLDAAEQSALNFVFLIGSGDLEDEEAFTLLGESDERYKVRGGNQRVVDELAKRVQPQIRTLHRLEAVRSRGTGFTLTFQTEGKSVDEQADVVILTVPFSILRDVKMDVADAGGETEGDSRAGVRHERQGARRLSKPAMGEAGILRCDVQRSDVPARVGEQSVAAGHRGRPDVVLGRQARASTSGRDPPKPRRPGSCPGSSARIRAQRPSATARSPGSTGRPSRGPKAATPATSRVNGRRSRARKDCRSGTCFSPASIAATIFRAT